MAALFERAEVAAMERAAAWAWPARERVDVDGWVVRLSGGGARRGNSVLPLAFGGRDVDAAITAVEAHYRRQGTRSYFQISSIAAPADLDQRLAGRGYAHEEPCLLLAKRLAPAAVPATNPVAVEVTDTPSADWLSVYAEPLEPVRKAAAPGVLAIVPQKRAFLLVRRDGMPLTSALGVVSPDGIALVECVATRAAARRTGGAAIVMDALEAWVAAAGASVAALQVVAANAAARKLYAGRGYVEAGRYHYRWRDVQSVQSSASAPEHAEPHTGVGRSHRGER